MNEAHLSSNDWNIVHAELLVLHNDNPSLLLLCGQLTLQPSGRIYIDPTSPIRKWFYRELIAYYLLYLQGDHSLKTLSVKRLPPDLSTLSDLLLDIQTLELEDCRGQTSFGWLSTLPQLRSIRLKNNKTITNISDVSLKNLENLELSGFTALETIEQVQAPKLRHLRISKSKKLRSCSLFHHKSLTSLSYSDCMLDKLATALSGHPFEHLLIDSPKSPHLSREYQGKDLSNQVQLLENLHTQFSEQYSLSAKDRKAAQAVQRFAKDPSRIRKPKQMSELLEHLPLSQAVKNEVGKHLAAEQWKWQEKFSTGIVSLRESELHVAHSLGLINDTIYELDIIADFSENTAHLLHSLSNLENLQSLTLRHYNQAIHLNSWSGVERLTIAHMKGTSIILNEITNIKQLTIQGATQLEELRLENLTQLERCNLDTIRLLKPAVIENLLALTSLTFGCSLTNHARTDWFSAESAKNNWGYYDFNYRLSNLPVLDTLTLNKWEERAIDLSLLLRPVPQLRTLNIWDSKILFQEDGRFLPKHQPLTALDFSLRYNQTRMLYIADLPQLQKLSVSTGRKAEKTLKLLKLENIDALAQLSINHCQVLHTIKTSPLPVLSRLTLSHTGSIKDMSATLSNFPRLQIFTLRGYTRPVLLSHLLQFAELRELCFISCSQLQQKAVLNSFAHLETLTIKDCNIQPDLE